MPTRRQLLAGTLPLAAWAVTGCSSDDPPPKRATDTATTATPTATSTTPAAPAPTTAGPPPNPVSIRALVERDYDGRRLRVGRRLTRTADYTRHAVRYRGDGLTISGVMNVPRGKGPFPVLVLNHGYIDPAVYVSGQGMMREQDWLARAGYVVMHVDYRGHAGSDDDRDLDLGLRLPYTVDVINAVLALRESDLPFLDADRVGLFGRSMGGAVTYNALIARPGLVRAAVVYAPTSSLAFDNVEQFNLDEPGDEVGRKVVRAYGRPSSNPRFWREVSSRPYLDAITEPLMIAHGTSDDTCPIRWSEATVRALRSAGRQVEYVTYRGEQHAFGPQWPRSMRRTTAFFDRHVRNAT